MRRAGRSFHDGSKILGRFEHGGHLLAQTLAVEALNLAGLGDDHGAVGIDHGHDAVAHPCGPVEPVEEHARGLGLLDRELVKTHHFGLNDHLQLALQRENRTGELSGLEHQQPGIFG